MKHFWSRQIARLLFIPLAAVAASFPAGADALPLDPPSEAAYLRPEIDLPLRPGERLVPTVDGACSVIVFAPHEERYERFAAYWNKAQWVGECRFGLAHGEGRIEGVDGSWSAETAMLYGLEINPLEAAIFEAGPEGGVSWDTGSGRLNLFAGEAYSDLGAKRYVVRLETEPTGEVELGDLVSDWYATDYLERHTFDADGRERAMSVSAWNMDTYCGLGLPVEFKPFEKEVKKACKKAGDKLVLFRREGFGADPWAERPVTWLKSCPVNRASRASDCGKLVRDALGKDAAELEKFLEEGDAAARLAAQQEVIDRFAPLEKAFEAELLTVAGD